MLFNILGQLVATLSTNDHIDSGDLQDLSGRGLSVTTGYRHNCFRVFANGPADHLTAFTIPCIGHRTGIDHIDIRLLIKIDFFISFTLKQLPDGLGFISVHFTSQCVECHRAHSGSPPNSPLEYKMLAKMAKGAVSARRILGPKWVGTAPEATASSASFSEKPPSGPVTTN